MGTLLEAQLVLRGCWARPGGSGLAGGGGAGILSPHLRAVAWPGRTSWWASAFMLTRAVRAPEAPLSPRCPHRAGLTLCGRASSEAGFWEMDFLAWSLAPPSRTGPAPEGKAAEGNPEEPWPPAAECQPAFPGGDARTHPPSPMRCSGLRPSWPQVASRAALLCTAVLRCNSFPFWDEDLETCSFL